MTINVSDPTTFIVIVVIVGIALVGLFFFGREMVSEGVLLAEQKKKMRAMQDQLDRKKGDKR